MEAPIIVFEVIYTGPAWMTLDQKFTTTVNEATEAKAREQFKRFYPRATIVTINPKINQ